MCVHELGKVSRRFFIGICLSALAVVDFDESLVLFRFVFIFGRVFVRVGVFEELSERVVCVVIFLVSLPVPVLCFSTS